MKLLDKFRIVFKALYNEDARFLVMNKLGLCDSMPDEEYLKRQYKVIMGKELDLEHPKTLNEKLQWLKLYNRRPEYTMMVDKYAVKDYVAKTIGEQYVISTIGVWERFEDIDFNKLPNQFVLKCTHDSGGLVICKDNKKLDVNATRKKIEKSLKNNFYFVGREWPYKNVKPRIIAEKYMTDTPDVDTFTDYKFYCFNGYVDCVLVCVDRNTGNPKFYFFDKNWNLLRYNKRGKAAPKDFTLPKPDNIEEMFEIASKLSENIPYVRVDLYNSMGQVYFGELTFFPDAGWDPNRLPEIDLYFGNLIDLRGIKDGY